MPGIKRETVVETIETAPGEFEPDEIQAIKRGVTEIENSRVLTMMTALYVRSRFPDLTVIEIFEKMEDPAFVQKMIRQVVEEGNEQVPAA